MGFIQQGGAMLSPRSGEDSSWPGTGGVPALTVIIEGEGRLGRMGPDCAGLCPLLAFGLPGGSVAHGIILKGFGTMSNQIGHHPEKSEKRVLRKRRLIFRETVIAFSLRWNPFPCPSG